MRVFKRLALWLVRPKPAAEKGPARLTLIRSIMRRYGWRRDQPVEAKAPPRLTDAALGDMLRHALESCHYGDRVLLVGLDPSPGFEGWPLFFPTLQNFHDPSLTALAIASEVISRQKAEIDWLRGQLEGKKP